MLKTRDNGYLEDGAMEKWYFQGDEGMKLWSVLDMLNRCTMWKE